MQRLWKTFKTFGDLRDHDETEYNVTVMSLRNIAKHLIEEKEKQICEFSLKCPHELACFNNCYFTDKAFVYVESEPEDTDNDDESEIDTVSKECSEIDEQNQHSESDTAKHNTAEHK